MNRAMRGRHALAGLATLLLCGDCEGKVNHGEPGPADIEASSARPPATVDPVTCLADDQIPTRQREILEAHGQRVVTALRGGAAQPLWNDLHPQLRSLAAREPFLAGLAGIKERLRTSTEDATVAGTILIQVVPGVSETLRLRCGNKTETPADDLTITTRVDGESLALVRLEVPGPAIVEGLAVRLRQRGEQWFLASIEGNPVRLGERGPEVFEKRADELTGANKPVPAYLLYGLAQTLTGRGTGVVSAARRRVNEKLKATMESKQFLDATSKIDVDGRALELVRLGLSTSPAGMAPNVKYVTGHALSDADAITHEASSLVRVLQNRHPEISEVFETAVVEAYGEHPVDPNRAYDAFQTVVTLRRPAAG